MHHHDQTRHMLDRSSYKHANVDPTADAQAAGSGPDHIAQYVSSLDRTLHSFLGIISNATLYQELAVLDRFMGNAAAAILGRAEKP